MRQTLLALALVALAGCAQQFPKEVGTEAVYGTVQATRTQNDVLQLLYMDGQDPHQKNWGKAGGYYVTVEGKEYAVSWESADKFKALKAGDKVNLHPSEYIVCEGQNDYEPSCRRLTKLYKSETRISPVNTP